MTFGGVSEVLDGAKIGETLAREHGHVSADAHGFFDPSFHG